MIFTRKLQALRYPQADTFDIRESSHYRTLVVWLELTRIRQLSEADRSTLKEIESPTWRTALDVYLTALSFPSPSAAASDVCVLEFLLREAVRSEYGDRSERYNRVVQGDKGRAGAEQGREIAEGKSAEDEKEGTAKDANQTQRRQHSTKRQIEWSDDAEIRSGAKSLCSLLHLPDPDSLPEPPSTLSLLRSLHTIISYHLALRSSAPSASAHSALLFLSSLPLGFDTGDADVNQVCTALRLLSVWELKAVQESITDRLHAALQRRDGKGRRGGQVDIQLGQVGR